MLTDADWDRFSRDGFLHLGQDARSLEAERARLTGAEA